MKKLILTLLLVAATSPAALASNAKSAVLDKNGDPVRSILTKTCVRHDFNEGSDICAPAPEPEPYVAPAPEPEPVAKLTKEELTIYFEFAKSDLEVDEVLKLNKFVLALIESEGVESLSIVGYADRIGSSASNLKLSKKRMMAVQSFINSKVEIPTEIVHDSARGEENSITSCDANEKGKALISCLAKDRRVEIVLNYFKK